MCSDNNSGKLAYMATLCNVQEMKGMYTSLNAVYSTYCIRIIIGEGGVMKPYIAFLSISLVKITLESRKQLFLKADECIYDWECP